MTSLLHGANPAAPIITADDAVAAARATALGAWIGAANGVVTSIASWLDRDRMATMMKDAAAQSMATQPGMDTPEAAQAQAMTMSMMEGMVPVIIGLTLVFAVIYLILGFVQWRKPNVVIPIILLALTALGLVSILQSAVTQPESLAMYGAVGWIGVGVTAVTLVLHIAGLRGGLALKRFREEAGG